jgi:hypothetical protein
MSFILVHRWRLFKTSLLLDLFICPAECITLFPPASHLHLHIQSHVVFLTHNFYL